ncbi:MAG: cytochrome c oxidase accessory protein CcoG [Gammaproteobacteria bacterium]|nr:cytochrome c oxidase accessory protein CcoG [Gammaproteobacteria bacterium]MCY4338596.1 cytochrome c oxidase accessory protein CcoG [Gammaproteobacteria bacterium]
MSASVEASLFEKRQKVYPREVHGRFALLRVSAVLGLLGLYYALPWVAWSGRQAVLLDLPARKFYLFGLTLWPQDFPLLTLLLISAALSLFFFTALAGRLWCGYACPQTVWTEVFLWIERHLEGSRTRQMRLDQGPLNVRKFRIKATKHTVWLLFSLWTGFTFVAYFTPARELAAKTLALQLGPWESFWLLFYSFATYGNAGWMREQVCKYMCPYARFQSAMFDADTLVISYDKKRGEPRGARRPEVNPAQQGLGDCINCTLCVQVCPTGIDIRDGLQYECIGCSACIDVCNDVMDKMNYAKGLIRYTTPNALEGKATRVLRPRIIIYGAILLGLLAILLFALANRTPLALDVIRDRNQLYRETREGLIENVYTLKVMNMDDKTRSYILDVTGIDGITVHTDQDPIRATGGEVLSVPVRVRAAEFNLTARSSAIEFILTTADEELSVTETARFLGPTP